MLTLKQTGEVRKYVGELHGRQIHVSQWVYTGRVAVSEIVGYDLINTINYGKGTSNSYVPEEITKAIKLADAEYDAQQLQELEQSRNVLPEMVANHYKILYQYSTRVLI